MRACMPLQEAALGGPEAWAERKLLLQRSRFVGLAVCTRVELPPQASASAASAPGALGAPSPAAAAAGSGSGAGGEQGPSSSAATTVAAAGPAAHLRLQGPGVRAAAMAMRGVGPAKVRSEWCRLEGHTCQGSRSCLLRPDCNSVGLFQCMLTVVLPWHSLQRACTSLGPRYSCWYNWKSHVLAGCKRVAAAGS